MIGLLQRVTEASVTVAERRVAAIGIGLLVLLGVQPADDERHARRLCERVLGYRVFVDERGRMNHSVLDCGGNVLVVPQFTLAADTSSGTRPGFSTAAPPARARALFDVFVARMRTHLPAVQAGVFGADMQVALVNDGPVTFWLEVR